jgi:hypothetical protein
MRQDLATKAMRSRFLDCNDRPAGMHGKLAFLPLARIQSLDPRRLKGRL